jgi:hypothetical protein
VEIQGFSNEGALGSVGQITSLKAQKMEAAKWRFFFAIWCLMGRRIQPMMPTTTDITP